MLRQNQDISMYQKFLKYPMHHISANIIKNRYGGGMTYRHNLQTDSKKQVAERGARPSMNTTSNI